jgi:hypothetical protein
MSALHSFPPPHPRSRSAKFLSASPAVGTLTVAPNPALQSTPRTRVSANPAYAHRRQGLEVVTKLVTYSTLSIFGMITLVNSIAYGYSQRTKLQELAVEVQSTKVRAQKVNTNFIHAFDPQAKMNVMQENSYKVAPDQLQIFLVDPAQAQPAEPKNPTKYL